MIPASCVRLQHVTVKGLASCRTAVFFFPPHLKNVTGVSEQPTAHKKHVDGAILTDGRRKTGKLEKKERTAGPGKCHSSGVINQSEKFWLEYLIIDHFCILYKSFVRICKTF